MSIQETYLQAIANAIREKEGSSDPIPANKFAERILALEIESPENPSRLPKGYKEVQYIHADNLASINTNYLWNRYSKIELAIKSDSLDDTGYIFSDTTHYLCKSSKSTCSIYSSDRYALDFSFPVQKIDISYESNTGQVKMDEISWKLGTVSSQATSTLYLFARENGGAGLPCNLYSVKLYTNGNIKMDMVPCVKDDMAGLYDLVGQAFYANVGSGILTPGPAV